MSWDFINQKVCKAREEQAKKDKLADLIQKSCDSLAEQGFTVAMVKSFLHSDYSFAGCYVVGPDKHVYQLKVHIEGAAHLTRV